MASKVIKVIKEFEEKLHDNHLYKVGKEYPAKGYKSTKARIAELSGNKNKYKTPFLEETSDEE